MTALELESETHALKISHQAGKQLAYSDAYEWFSHEENGIRPLDAKLAQTLVDQVTGLILIVPVEGELLQQNPKNVCSDMRIY